MIKVGFGPIAASQRISLQVEGPGGISFVVGCSFLFWSGRSFSERVGLMERLLRLVKNVSWEPIPNTFLTRTQPVR